MKNLMVAVAVTVVLMTCSKSPTGPANQAETPLTLTTTQSSPAGVIVRTPDKETYARGDTVRLAVTPAAGYAFSGWSGDMTAAAETLTIVMTKNFNVYANFTNINTGKKVFSINTESANGSVDLSPAGGVYDSGSVVSVMAVPEYGVKFSSWSGLMTGTDSVAFLTVSQNGTLRANFIIDPNAVFATLNVNPLPVNGKIMLDPVGVRSGNDYKYKPGTSVTISAVPFFGYELAAWGGDFTAYSASDTSFTTTMDSNYTISATFTKAPDGVVWTSRTSGNGNGLLSAAFNGSLIVVVGNMGTILTSPDAMTWTLRTSGVTSCLNCVIWTGPSIGSGTGMFVCVGDDGTILASTDGITWAIKNSSTTYGLLSVVWTGSQFVAVGGQFVNSGLNYNCVVTSRDANTWTTRNGGIGIWYSVAWTGTRLVATGYDYDFTTVSDNSMSVMYTSADGISWTMGGNGISSSTSLNALIWSQNQLVAVGGSRNTTSPASAVYVSPDGLTWNRAYPVSTRMLSGVTWTGNNYVAVGNNGAIVTTDGSDASLLWKSQMSGTSNPIYGVTWAGTQCIAVGYGGMILTSP